MGSNPTAGTTFLLLNLLILNQIVIQNPSVLAPQCAVLVQCRVVASRRVFAYLSEALLKVSIHTLLIDVLVS